MKASFLFNILRTIADNLRALIEFTLIVMYLKTREQSQTSSFVVLYFVHRRIHRFVKAESSAYTNSSTKPTVHRNS